MVVRALALALVAMLLAPLFGCHVIHTGKHEVEGATNLEALRTRADVTQRFGIPTRITEGPELTYIYKNARSKGVSVGVVVAGSRWLIEHNWEGHEYIEFAFDKQDRITSVRAPQLYEGLGYRFWAFGD